MGCGASGGMGRKLDESSSTEDVRLKQEMAEEVARHACMLMAQQALDSVTKDGSFGDYQIGAPKTEMGAFREMQASLEKSAESAKSANQSSKEAGDSLSKAVGGGLVGSMLGGAAAAMADVGIAAGQVLGSGMDKLAADLKKYCDDVDADFAACALQVTKDLQKEIAEAYNKILKNAPFPNALGLIRGDKPYGQAQYNACNKDRIAKAFMTAVVGESPALLEALIKVTETKVGEHKVTKAWKDMCSFAKTNNPGINALDNIGKFDINKYIAEEIIKGLGDIMAKREAGIRSQPGQCSAKAYPQTLPLMFSGSDIYMCHYDTFKTESGF